MKGRIAKEGAGYKRERKGVVMNKRMNENKRKGSNENTGVMRRMMGKEVYGVKGKRRSDEHNDGSEEGRPS